jgi:hypothetical protein
MGEAKRKLAAMLADRPGCIYCAGENVATTIEHMPPISVFEGRQRPKGLEFPACQPCNHNTGHADLVAAMLARFWPDAESEIQQKEAKKIIAAISNNIPGLLQEMNVGRGGEKLMRKRHSIPIEAHPMRVNGPIMTAHIETFAAKIGFALHYELRGAPVPAQGGVQPMWFTNVQALNGQIPSVLFEMLPSPSTLSQGKKSVGTQFKYSYASGEQDHLLYFASFNESFAVAGVTALDRAVYLERHASRFPIFAPGHFRRRR